MSILAALFSGCVRYPTEDAYPSVPTTVEEALRLLPTEETLVSDVLERAHDLYGEGRGRWETIEAKANTLLGAAGLAATLLVASGGLLLDRPETLEKLQILPFGISVVVTVAAFLYAAYKAMQSLRVSPWAELGPLSLYNTSSERSEAKREWAAHLLVAKAHNDRTNNVKAGWLSEAQAWFVTGIVLLVLSALALMLVAVLASETDAAAKVEPTDSMRLIFASVVF